MAEGDTQQSAAEQESLGSRMKSYEANADHRLETGLPAIIRLDGHGFSKFTSRFQKPFDERLHIAMISTCVDLLQKHPGATLAYTQSDEITLVLPQGMTEFNGRIQKIGSLAASFCSVAFLKHLERTVSQTPEPAVCGFDGSNDDEVPLPHFDARVFNVASVEECVNNLLWRCRGDAIRNSVSSFARSLFSTKQLHKKTTEEVIRMMEDEKGVDYYQVAPKWALEGSIVKREQVPFEAVDQKTGETVTTIRTRARAEDRGIRTFSEESVGLVREKYWQSG